MLNVATFDLIDLISTTLRPLRNLLLFVLSPVSGPSAVIPKKAETIMTSMCWRGDGSRTAEEQNKRNTEIEQSDTLS